MGKHIAMCLSVGRAGKVTPLEALGQVLKMQKPDIKCRISDSIYPVIRTTHGALRQHLLDRLGESRILLACLGECASMGKQMDLLQGTLDMLILKAVSLG